MIDLKKIDLNRMTPDDKRALLVQLEKAKAAAAGNAGPVRKRESGLLTSGSKVADKRKPKVGAALKAIFEAVGIAEELPSPNSAGCGGCGTMRAYLDGIGIEWCRANQRKIADYIAAKAKQYMAAKGGRLAAGVAWAGIVARAAAAGIIVDPRDPFFGIVGKAIATAADRAAAP